jgi:hypothetical protein
MYSTGNRQAFAVWRTAFEAREEDYYTEAFIKL